MKEIEIIEVPVASADFPTQYCVSERNERYYIAYENNIQEHNSILFNDLKWVRKHFGVDRTEDSPITKESLNSGRMNEIERLKLCIKARVPMWELSKVNKDGTIRINPETNKPIQVYRLSKEGKEQFQRMIDKGLLILCKYID